MQVFVTGASGYVGRAVVEALIRRGHEVVALQRPGSERAFQQPGVRTVGGNIVDPASLRGRIDGCDAVVHLVGIIREIPRRGVTMDAIHRQGTRNVVDEARRAGIRRFLHMSALGTRPNAVSAYHRSKWAAEEYVRASGLDYTIFRPSVVFGKGGPGPEFVGQLAELVRRAPVVPVIGDGRFCLQPVSVRNVADGFALALEKPETIGKTYEVAGPARLTYLEILERIAAALGKPLRRVHVPLGLMKALVPALQRLPGFPLTQDQLIMLEEGNVGDERPFFETFGLQPEPFRVELNAR